MQPEVTQEAFVLLTTNRGEEEVCPRSVCGFPPPKRDRYRVTIDGVTTEHDDYRDVAAMLGVTATPVPLCTHTITLTNGLTARVEIERDPANVAERRAWFREAKQYHGECFGASRIVKATLYRANLYWARLSAPVYMDCTSWVGPFKTETAALAALAEEQDVCAECWDQCWETCLDRVAKECQHASCHAGEDNA